MKGKARQVPEEHRDFIDAYRALLKKYPKAPDRYALADKGPEPAFDVVWECEEFVFGDGSPGLDCRPVIK
jgi:hypothetical protein